MKESTWTSAQNYVLLSLCLWSGSQIPFLAVLSYLALCTVCARPCNPPPPPRPHPIPPPPSSFFIPRPAELTVLDGPSPLLSPHPRPRPLLLPWLSLPRFAVVLRSPTPPHFRTRASLNPDLSRSSNARHRPNMRRKPNPSPAHSPRGATPSRPISNPLLQHENSTSDMRAARICMQCDSPFFTLLLLESECFFLVVHSVHTPSDSHSRGGRSFWGS